MQVLPHGPETELFIKRLRFMNNDTRLFQILDYVPPHIKVVWDRIWTILSSLKQSKKQHSKAVNHYLRHCETVLKPFKEEEILFNTDLTDELSSLLQAKEFPIDSLVVVRLRRQFQILKSLNEEARKWIYERPNRCHSYEKINALDRTGLSELISPSSYIPCQTTHNYLIILGDLLDTVTLGGFPPDHPKVFNWLMVEKTKQTWSEFWESSLRLNEHKNDVGEDSNLEPANISRPLVISQLGSLPIVHSNHLIQVMKTMEEYQQLKNQHTLLIGFRRSDLNSKQSVIDYSLSTHLQHLRTWILENVQSNEFDAIGVSTGGLLLRVYEQTRSEVRKSLGCDSRFEAEYSLVLLRMSHVYED